MVKAEPEAACWFRGRWDWACDECSGDFTDAVQVFSPKPPCNDVYPNRVAHKKLTSIKGHGRAFELEYSSEPLKPLKLYGWSVTYAGRKRS